MWRVRECERTSQCADLRVLMDKDDSLEFGLTNVEASFGDGASNFVTLSGGKGALLSMPDGVALQASGTVSVSAPQVNLSGTMDLKINNVGVAFDRDVIKRVLI